MPSQKQIKGGSTLAGEILLDTQGLNTQIKNEFSQGLILLLNSGQTLLWFAQERNEKLPLTLEGKGQKPAD